MPLALPVALCVPVWLALCDLLTAWVTLEERERDCERLRDRACVLVKDDVSLGETLAVADAERDWLGVAVFDELELAVVD